MPKEGETMALQTFQQKSSDAGKKAVQKFKAEIGKKTENLKEKNKELKKEPERALQGAVMGNTGALIVTKVSDSMIERTAPDSYVRKHQEIISPVVTGVLGLAVAYHGASKGNPIEMHTGMHMLSNAAGQAAGRTRKTKPAPAAPAASAASAASAAPAAPAAPKAPEVPAAEIAKKIDGAFNPYEVGAACALEGPEQRQARRQARRQRMISNWGQQLVTEQPEAVQGSDSVEEHIGELLEGIDTEIGGSLDDALETGIQAAPLLMLGGQALAHILKAMPQLSALVKQPDDAAKASVAGLTPATDAFLLLEGVDIEGLSIEGKKAKTREQRQLERAQRKVKRAERKQKEKQSKDLVKSGELTTRLERQDQRIQQMSRMLSSMQADMARMVSSPSQPQATQQEVVEEWSDVEMLEA